MAVRTPSVFWSGGQKGAFVDGPGSRRITVLTPGFVGLPSGGC